MSLQEGKSLTFEFDRLSSTDSLLGKSCPSCLANLIMSRSDHLMHAASCDNEDRHAADLNALSVRADRADDPVEAHHCLTSPNSQSSNNPRPAKAVREVF